MATQDPSVKLFNGKTKWLYVGPEKQFNGLFYSELENPYKEDEDWKSGDDEYLVYMMSRERHEQTDSRQFLLPKVSFGAMSEIDTVEVEDHPIGGLIWQGTVEDRNKHFKKLGK